MTDQLRKIVEANRSGACTAVPSVCSSHPQVLKATLLQAHRLHKPIVVEATSNQVNQEGGYTGMDARAFVRYIRKIAESVGVDHQQLMLGGDHLGPQAWRHLPAEQAMDKARALVKDYVQAGFTKIHLDCSEGCNGEPAQVGDELASARAADLAAVCHESAPNPEKLLYVIGTEVPPPGGAKFEEEHTIKATSAAAAKATLQAHRDAFERAGQQQALEQIAGLVVQPGVEFTPRAVYHLPLDRDPQLRDVMMSWPGLCLEAHSTDYQQPVAYKRLAELGFAFQKVGPALTFAYRQAVYALDELRAHLDLQRGPSLPETMDSLMCADPTHWRSHYQGDASVQKVLREYSYADRIRYYWPQPAAQEAIQQLEQDLANQPLPMDELYEYFSDEVIDVSETLINDCQGSRPQALVQAQIQEAMAPYFI